LSQSPAGERRRPRHGQGERPERIAKLLARAGVLARATPTVDRRGTSLRRWSCTNTPAVTVTAANDIRVDGKPLPAPDRARLWRYHKPAGLVTTHRDEKGRTTVFDALPKELPRLISIGRLDLNSEGLLLLTNDGALSRRLELPSTGWLRRYKVRVHGEVEPERLAALEKGVTIDSVSYGPIRASLERRQGSNAWIAMALREGKNREVRRVLEHLGFQVTRLIRLAYGPFQLGNLARGAVAEISKKVLQEQLGSGDPEAVAPHRKPMRRKPHPAGARADRRR
jgi:23S rRNA pseudouridine2605 synthase